MEIITRTEAETLDRARGILYLLEQRLRDLGHNTLGLERGWGLSEQPAGTINDLMSIGRAQERAEDAEQGIFDLLNVLAHHLEDATAGKFVTRSKMVAADAL